MPEQLVFKQNTQRKRLFISGDVLNQRELDHATRFLTLSGDGEWYRLQLDLQVDPDAVRRSVQESLTEFANIRVVVRDEKILVQGEARDADEQIRVQRIAESHVFQSKHVVFEIMVEGR